MNIDGTFPSNGELLHRLVVAVDIAGYSKLDVLEQRTAQAMLATALDKAAADAGLVRADWYRQPCGDGELSALPANTDAAWVLAVFVDHLALELGQLRCDARGPRLRLRVAVHHGTMTAAPFGLAGDAPIVTARLLDARASRAALDAEPTEDLVLVISQQLFEDVVATRFHGLSPERFTRMRARAKGVTYRGYVCVGTPK